MYELLSSHSSTQKSLKNVGLLNSFASHWLLLYFLSKWEPKRFRRVDSLVAAHTHSNKPLICAVCDVKLLSLGTFTFNTDIYSLSGVAGEASAWGFEEAMLWETSQRTAPRVKLTPLITLQDDAKHFCL